MNHDTKQKNQSFAKRGLLFGLFFLAVSSFTALALPAPAYAVESPQAKAAYQCGSGKNTVKTSIDIGCQGASCKSSNVDGCSALIDMVFAIIRFLSAGVGVVVIGSVIYAGIQYASARDDPGAVGKAKERIGHSLTALLIFIFAYAILNYVLPAGFFK